MDLERIMEVAKLYTTASTQLRFALPKLAPLGRQIWVCDSVSLRVTCLFMQMNLPVQASSQTQVPLSIIPSGA